MKLSRLGEFGLIERVRRILPGARGVRIGIGDDAAWVRTSSGSCLITTDLMVEGVHFDLRWTTPEDLGYKALAVNLSDIAAMGGVPAYAVLSVGVPARFDSRDIEALYRGVGRLAALSRVAVVGGDTSTAPKMLISVCVIGHPPPRPLTRGGAREGDEIYVSGTLGDAALALMLLKHRSRKLRHPEASVLLARHHRPSARVELGARLARSGMATAMIDVSDGLLQDLGHICRASNVGAVVWQERLPLSPAYRLLCGDQGSRFALTGGEDYELLFCARRRERPRIEALARRLSLPLTRIGECVAAERGTVVLDGAGRPVGVGAGGYDHFKSP
ncbi:MAG TPA: thiamine-phosphate kinase [candidate division Zixibacteria bacterium]|nr:thiamine-phosphate kinase [candidate division Zixibacteria bacterium]